jgi:hypothetical protein
MKGGIKKHKSLMKQSTASLNRLKKMSTGVCLKKNACFASEEF